MPEQKREARPRAGCPGHDGQGLLVSTDTDHQRTSHLALYQFGTHLHR